MKSSSRIYPDITNLYGFNTVRISLKWRKKNFAPSLVEDGMRNLIITIFERFEAIDEYKSFNVEYKRFGWIDIYFDVSIDSINEIQEFVNIVEKVLSGKTVCGLESDILSFEDFDWEMFVNQTLQDFEIVYGRNKAALRPDKMKVNSRDKKEPMSQERKQEYCFKYIDGSVYIDNSVYPDWIPDQIVNSIYKKNRFTFSVLTENGFESVEERLMTVVPRENETDCLFVKSPLLKVTGPGKAIVRIADSGGKWGDSVRVHWSASLIEKELSMMTQQKFIQSAIKERKENAPLENRIVFFKSLCSGDLTPKSDDYEILTGSYDFGKIEEISHVLSQLDLSKSYSCLDNMRNEFKNYS